MIFPRTLGEGPFREDGFCDSAFGSTQGLPGVAESLVSSSNGKPSPWGEDARRADEGKWFMRLFSVLEVSGHGWMRDPTD